MIPPEPTRSAMLSEPGPITRWIWRRLFDRVPQDPGATERVKALTEAGQLVYVMRTRSLLDYLFFNFLFLHVGLPLARFANGVDLSLFRGLRTWFGSLWARITGRDTEGPSPIERLEGSVAAGGSALIFMKRRRLTEERQANPGYIEALVRQQRTQDRPILLLPQLITWPRQPPSKQPKLLDALFGNQDTPGRTRKLIFWLRHRKQAAVRLGEPIDLKAAVEQHAGWTDARLARKVRRVLFIHLGHEAMAIRGPAVKSPEQIKREVLERRRFQQELAALADSLGMPTHRAEQEARKYLDEIAATTRFELLHVLGWVLDRIFNRVFKGVEVDAAGMKRVKEAARLSRQAPLILVPSHKSHMDYLVISWVFMRNEFIPPHIAAGANLSFFPLGSVLRRAGAFFLRRSFKGIPLYTLVFRRYLWKLVREGYPIEFFMEGGRSRTGKLLPPKLGMLAMLLEGVRRGEYKDLQFVPINLSYERVLETASYRRELTGEQKEAESMGGVVKARKILRSRYGRVYVSFEEPVRLSTWLAERGVEDLTSIDDDALRDQGRSLGYHLMRRVQEATTVSSSALVGAVLLSHDQPGMSGERLRPMVGFVLDLLIRRRTRLSRALTHRLATHADFITSAQARGDLARHQARGEAVRELLDEALTLLRKLVERQERAGRSIYTVPDRARIELDYYRNTILAVLAAECIVATVVHTAPGPVSREQLNRQARRLSYWFRLEFIYPTQVTFAENLDQTVRRMQDDGLLEEDDAGRVVATAPRIISFLAGMIRHLVEGYWVAADALRDLGAGPLEKSEWLDHAREHGERLFLEGEISRPEAPSTAVLGNALEMFRQEGLVTRTERGVGRKTQSLYQLGKDTSVEAVAYRRDDLGEFRVRRAVRVLVASEEPLLGN